jgi:predicted dehydrogenase
LSVINAGIVGLGWWGRTLVEAVSGGQSEEINFVAGAARTHTDDLKAFAKEHQFELYDSYEKLLQHPKLDAVVLATPHSLHVEQVVAAAKAGKHVFCEKPFALTGAEAEEGVEAVKKAGVTLGLGYNRRWHPEMTKLREQIDSGELGTMVARNRSSSARVVSAICAAFWRSSG